MSRYYLRPTAFLDSPVGLDGQVARLAGGLLWHAAYELIERDRPKRLVPAADWASLPDEVQPIVTRLAAPRAPLTLGPRTIHIDCDVIQADGGTRTASITGAFVAAHDAVSKLIAAGKLARSPITDHVAAISVGVYEGAPVLDLDYAEDSRCDTDMNVVMTGAGGFVEVQGTAEGVPFSRAEMNALLDLAQSGIGQLVQLQKDVLGAAHV